jgi:vacuolar protein-sorting-associated protein 4
VPDKDDPQKKVTKLTPCSPGAPGAIEKSWTDIGSDELLEPPLTISDFERSISVNRKTVTEADVAKHIAFTNEAGEWGCCLGLDDCLAWSLISLIFDRW